MTWPGSSTAYVYDGGGNRVKETEKGVTTYSTGNHYEVTASQITKYYYFNGQRVELLQAMGFRIRTRYLEMILDL